MKTKSAKVEAKAACTLEERFNVIVILATTLVVVFAILSAWKVPDLDRENFVFLRLVGLIILSAALIQSIAWMRKIYLAQHQRQWWSVGDRIDDPSWFDVLNMTAGDPNFDPVSYRGTPKKPSMLTDSGYLAMVVTALSFAIEAASALSRNKMLNFLMSSDKPVSSEQIFAGEILNFTQNLTAFLALIAAVASIYFTHRQLQAKVKADSRQAWIDKLRSHISNFIALVDELHRKQLISQNRFAKKNTPKSSVNLIKRLKLTSHRVEMEMMLNPSEKDHRLLMYLTIKLAFFDYGNSDFRKVQDVYNIRRSILLDPDFKINRNKWRPILTRIPEKGTSDYEDKYSDLIGYTIRLSHVVLKREWERVKATR